MIASAMSDIQHDTRHCCFLVGGDCFAVASTGVGVAGLASDGPNLAYSAPCSQGPGAKSYTFTVYALSAKPSLPTQANQVTGAVLAAAIADRTLGSSALTVTYTR